MSWSMEILVCPLDIRHRTLGGFERLQLNFRGGGSRDAIIKKERHGNLHGFRTLESVKPYSCMSEYMVATMVVLGGRSGDAEEEEEEQILPGEDHLSYFFSFSLNL